MLSFAFHVNTILRRKCWCLWRRACYSSLSFYRFFSFSLLFVSFHSFSLHLSLEAGEYRFHLARRALASLSCVCVCVCVCVERTLRVTTTSEIHQHPEMSKKRDATIRIHFLASLYEYICWILHYLCMLGVVVYVCQWRRCPRVRISFVACIFSNAWRCVWIRGDAVTIYRVHMRQVTGLFAL